MNQSRAMRIVAYPVTAILMAALAAVVLFAACFVYETEKKVAFWAAAAIVAICATPHFRRRLRERCSIFFLLVTAYILLAGASTFYAYAPKFALSEFSRLLGGYAIFLAVFSFAKMETMPNVAAVFCGATGILSLLHLDAASGGLFAHDIMRKFQTWTGGYFNDLNGNLTYGYGPTSNRLNGLFGNSNSMATMCAIGIFLALYLLLRAKGPRRLLPCAVLIVNAVTFLMCISLGATLSLGLTVLVVLVCLKGAHNRLSFLLITMETLLVAAAVAVLSFPYMGLNVPQGYRVLVYCAVGWLVLFALDWLLRPRLIDFLCKKIQFLLIGILTLVVLLGAALGIAATQTSSVTLQGSDTLIKRFFPGTGTCQITLQLEDEAKVYISSTSKAEILKETATELYNNSYQSPITLEVPEDAVEIQVYIAPLDGGTVTVHGISYEGTEKSAQITPGYRFIPNEILARLQGLSTNHSVMLRLSLMGDGLKMWKQAPIFGRGLGGFENGLSSVQTFFYESKYAHSHYVQALCDLGVVGMVLYVAILVSAVASLWHLRRNEEEGKSLFPAMLGAVLMIVIHGGLEISMSVAEVLLIAFGMFGMVAVVAPMPVAIQKHGKLIAWVISIPLAVLAAIYGCLLIQNVRAAKIVSQETVTSTQLKECVDMDVFERDDYRLTYVVAAMSIQDEEVYAQADIYADELQQGYSNAVGSYLTEYYLHRGYYEKAAAASAKFLQYTRSNPESWNEQFHIFEDAILSGKDAAQLEQISLDTYEQMIKTNEQQIDDIMLDDRSTAFVTRLLSTEGTLGQRLNELLYDSQFAADTNADGRPDNVKVLWGTVQWKEDGTATATENSAVRVGMVPTHAATYTITVETATPEQISVYVNDVRPQYTVTDHGIALQIQLDDAQCNETLDVRIYAPEGCSFGRVYGAQADVTAVQTP